MFLLTYVLPVSQPCMLGPPLQEDGLPLAPQQQWAEQWALLLLLPLLPLQVDKPAFPIIRLLFAATAGVAVAAGAGYGIYRLVKNKANDRVKCPWCGKGPRKDSEDSEKGRPVQASPAKTDVEKKVGWKKSSSGVAVGDFFLRTEEEMVEFALKRSLEEQLCSRSAESSSDGAEQNNPQAGNRDTLQFDEFDCPICAEVNE